MSGETISKRHKNNSARFSRYVGIDYSGAKAPDDRLSGLQLFEAEQGGEAVRIHPPESQPKRASRWSRRALFDWLSGQLKHGPPMIVGIDHGFSFPRSYFQRYGLRSWNAFLNDFVAHWPTDQEGITVESVRKRQTGRSIRTGEPSELRLTEKWTTSAKSVFQFDVQGQVAKSTHAGLPWLRRLRATCRPHVHFWPFDGWEIPENKSVIAEIFPSLFRKRYARDGRTVDQQDAYSVSRWLAEMDARGELSRFLSPPLSRTEKNIALLEGWVLGVC